jgi:ubiquinone/menaquinone biosynthesis C-methylase UbiE
MAGVPTRHRVIVDLLDPRPADHIVEIGCGHGVTATLVLDRLTTGSYTGIDRSAAMIAAATARNTAAVEAGRATFVESALESFDGRACDRLFAARVRELATPDGLAVAHRLLTPGGVLVLAFDAPSAARTDAAARAATRDVGGAGFADVRRVDAPFDGGIVAVVVARRA